GGVRDQDRTQIRGIAVASFPDRPIGSDTGTDKGADMESGKGTWTRHGEGQPFAPADGAAVIDPIHLEPGAGRQPRGTVGVAPAFRLFAGGAKAFDGGLEASGRGQAYTGEAACLLPVHA